MYLLQFVTNELKSEEQIRRVFEDNLGIFFAYFSIKTYVVGTLYNRLAEVILMSTHKVCFYGELTKIILQLSPNTLLIWSSVSNELKCQGEC